MDQKKFDVIVHESANSIILDLLGELDLAVAPYFRSVIEPLIGGSQPLILNLKDLTYIDSTGMGIIIFVLKSRAEAGTSFQVEQVPSKIKKLFDLTGITKFLPIEKPPHNNEKADGFHA